jgi:hypothetical protein
MAGWEAPARPRRDRRDRIGPGSSGATRAALVRAGRCDLGEGMAGAAARGDLAVAAVRVEAMREREREAGGRKVGPRYYTHLCSSGQHFSR